MAVVFQRSDQALVVSHTCNDSRELSIRPQHLKTEGFIVHLDDFFVCERRDDQPCELQNVACHDVVLRSEM